MRRWHEDYPRTLREWKKHVLRHVEDYILWGSDPNAVDCVCEVQKGRFRKKHAFDCGRTQCHVCHGDKYPRRSMTRHEFLAELKLHEECEHVSRGSDRDLAFAR